MNVIPDEDSLRLHLTNSTGWVKEQLRRADLGSNFTLTITIEGPIQQEDGVKLVYQLDHSRNYSSSVKGNTLASVTWELLRRNGWQQDNDGVLLEWKGGADAPSLDKNY